MCAVKEDTEGKGVVAETAGLAQREGGWQKVDRSSAGVCPASADPRTDVEPVLFIIGQGAQRQAGFKALGFIVEST